MQKPGRIRRMITTVLTLSLFMSYHVTSLAAESTFMNDNYIEDGDITESGITDDSIAIVDDSLIGDPEAIMNISEESAEDEKTLLEDSSSAEIDLLNDDGTTDIEHEEILQPDIENVMSKINPPRTDSDDITTWDCIWFGSYWQEDTNGDGYCYDKKTAITWNEDLEFKTDQYGKRTNKEIGVFSEDDKQPVKWRILDIDEAGNALLLADKVIDIAEYNEGGKDVTWETSTLRSYLNGYGPAKNVCRKDYSEEKSFLYRAFTRSERDSIIAETVTNSDNPFHGTEAGGDTVDKVFCLSLDEATTYRYGFIKNETKPAISYGDQKRYQVVSDPCRGSYCTEYVECKPGYIILVLPGGKCYWHLRGPGESQRDSLVVSASGNIGLSGDSLNPFAYGIRPALRINLFSSAALWSYAGTVDSNRCESYAITPVNVTNVSLLDDMILGINETVLLTPEVEPSIATDRSVTWESSDPETVLVNSLGEVTGLREGTAVITVRTNDGDFSDACTVTVKEEIEKEYSLIPGESRRLLLNERRLYTYGVKWRIVNSNPGGCITLKNGVVTAKKSGTAIVTAEHSTGSFSYKVTVNGNVPAEDTPLSINGKAVKLSVPKTVTVNSGSAKAKTVTVGIPKTLRPFADNLTYKVTDEYGVEEPGIIELGSPKFNNENHGKASKASFEVIISGTDKNAAFIVWSIKDDNGNEGKAVTKVLVTRPVSTLVIEEIPPILESGEGYRLNVFWNDDNTDPKDLSFGVKMRYGKGIKCSKSGFIIAANYELSEATVIIKAGKVSKKVSVIVSGHPGNTMLLNKSNVTVAKPKETGKPVTVKLKANSPRNGSPAVDLSVEGNPKGIETGNDGIIKVTSEASPGCYTVVATVKDPYPGYNTACCELIVK